MSDQIRLLEYLEKVGGEENAWWNRGRLSNTLVARQFREAREVGKVRNQGKEIVKAVVLGIAEGRFVSEKAKERR